jgi:hypothetical protein
VGGYVSRFASSLFAIVTPSIIFPSSNSTALPKPEGSTHLVYTGLREGLEDLKIETRSIDERFIDVDERFISVSDVLFWKFIFSRIKKGESRR